LAASQTPNFDLSKKFQVASSPRRYRSPAKSASGAETPRDLNSRVKILELYTLHVLLRNNEWDYAREFITASDVLDEERREAFLLALQSLQQEQQLEDQRKEEAIQRREEDLRREAEEARRLRAENEERERRRIREERVRREGSEVDYGIEETPSIAGSSNGRPAQKPSSLSRQSVGGPATSAKTQPRGKPAAPPSLTSRAGRILFNIRALLEQMSRSLQSNPTTLLRLLAFVIGILVMLGQKKTRERIAGIAGSGWAKLRATAGMGVKVSYI
jgi:hypothetical protein